MRAICIEFDELDALFSSPRVREEADFGCSADLLSMQVVELLACFEPTQERRQV
jgi:hypothetical protein